MKESAGYNDLIFRLVISLISAHVIIAYGATQGFFQLLLLWYYYVELLISFVIAFLLTGEVYLVTVKLDKYFDWLEKPARRIGLQFLLGLVFPSLSAFLLAAVYFAVLGYNILKTNYSAFDFPVIVIMLVALNIYYLAFYFYKQMRASQSRLVANTPVQDKEAEHKARKVIIIHNGSKNIPLPVESASYFYHDGEYNFVRTCDHEDFVISQSLDEIQEQLPDKQFFRVNRKMIVNFTACGHFEALNFGKLELFLTPVPREPVIISQKRAMQFKKWVAR